MARSDMSDLEWEFIKAVLPNKSRGVKRADDRRVINGIFYVLRTGIPWADLPSEYGPPTTIYNRFNRWTYAGIWDQIMEAVADASNVDTVMVDGTSVRALHSATTLKKTTRVAASGARAVGYPRKSMHLPIRTDCQSGSNSRLDRLMTRRSAGACWMRCNPVRSCWRTRHTMPTGSER